MPLRAAQTQYETAIASLDEDDAEKARQVIYWKNQISALDANDPASAKALSNAMEQLVIAERAQADTEKKNERLRAEARKALTESRQRGQRIMADASGAIRGHSRSMVAATLNVAGDSAAYDGSIQMQYTGTDLRGHGPMGFGQGGMFRPSGAQMPELPEGETFPENRQPAGDAPDFPRGGQPADFHLPDGETMPADFDPSQWGGAPPEAMTPPEGGDAQMPPSHSNRYNPGSNPGEARTEFYMNDMVNFFSGVTTA